MKSQFRTFSYVWMLKVVSSEQKGGWGVISIDSYWQGTEVLGILF